MRVVEDWCSCCVIALNAQRASAHATRAESLGLPLLCYRNAIGRLIPARGVVCPYSAGE